VLQYSAQREKGVEKFVHQPCSAFSKAIMMQNHIRMKRQRMVSLTKIIYFIQIYKDKYLLQGRLNVSTVRHTGDTTCEWHFKAFVESNKVASPHPLQNAKKKTLLYYNLM
jgi:hypothetical protein